MDEKASGFVEDWEVVDGDRESAASEFGEYQSNSAAFKYNMDGNTRQIVAGAAAAAAEKLNDGDLEPSEYEEGIERSLAGLHDIVITGVNQYLDNLENGDLVALEHEGEEGEREKKLSGIYSGMPGMGYSDEDIQAAATEYIGEVFRTEREKRI